MAQDSPRLSAPAREAINETPAGEVALSGVSLYEIAWLLQRRRIKLEQPLEQFLGGIESRFELVPPDAPIAVAAAQLPPAFPSDPIDRIIAATAQVFGAALITADERIRRSGAVRTIW